ncbi:hypothetical protein SAMD00019534_016140 [Acytostelium subglobosum LB1]|uniref:hypothetical protein n=1 Tax=Acytostelium subglobosum LB1 TaxID=1410327 RepID=UPI0006449EF7|nr:hypothetical protein SAMD00019534_016140 [Acytostelium subglobosum LB1]GAM18439.1 hypothetical protein SAMD00019534_016140 [Acytostelium subglobosum LB1]|eukprot:XP_012757659.1 hypothetical protein SAMD00019534_016140 [Acytostelium subglobosum LB1]
MSTNAKKRNSQSTKGKSRSSTSSNKLQKLSSSNSANNTPVASTSSLSMAMSPIKIDETVTPNTLSNLLSVLSNECTKKIFYEFTEREHSSNHVMFWFAARSFREEYIHVAPTSKSTGDVVMSTETRHPRSESVDAATPRSNSIVDDDVGCSSSGGNNNNSNNSNPAATTNTLTIEVSVANSVMSSSPDSRRSNSTAETSKDLVPMMDGASSSSSPASPIHKVSRESSAMDIEMTESMADGINFEKANILFEKYLSSTSPSEVNLDYRTLNDITKRIQAHQITDKIFDNAIKEIFEAINNDSFHRFKNSPIYTDLLQQCTDIQSSSSSPSSSSPPSSPSSPSSSATHRTSVTIPSSSSLSDSGKSKKAKSSSSFSCFK